MATNVETWPQQERRHHERRRDWSPAFLRGGMKVSWGGIWGGVLVALGILMLMTALGLAIGISAFDPGDTGAGTLGTGAAIWGAISLLVALFVGGMTSTRIGLITDRTTGFFEGSLVWVIAMLLMAYVAGSGAGMLARGAFGLVGGTAQMAGSVAQQQIGNIGDIDTSGTVEQIAEQLRDPAVAQRVASVTGLSVSEVQSTLQATADRVEANADDPAQAAQEAQRGLAELAEQAQLGQQLGQQLEQGAEAVQPQAASAAWITFFALVLSLGASVLGALLGRRNTERRSRDVAPAGAEAT